MPTRTILARPRVGHGWHAVAVPATDRRLGNVLRCPHRSARRGRDAGRPEYGPQQQVALAAGQALLREIVGFGRPRRQPAVQEVGAAAQHAAGRVRPRFGHRAPADQVLTVAWNQKRAAGRLATGRRRVAEPFMMGRVVLHVIQ